jgi:hypothetical protein
MGSDFVSDATHQPTRQWQQAETEALIIRHRFDPNAVLEVAGGRRWGVTRARHPAADEEATPAPPDRAALKRSELVEMNTLSPVH